MPPIGFTYDSYMTRSEFDALSEEEKIPYMMRTLVVEDSDEEIVSGCMTHFLKASESALTAADVAYLGMLHSQEASEEFEKTPDHFRSVITSDVEKYAFFSIPNDDGWTASVNGTETDILDINGFMAVRIGPGRNEILFTYDTPGRKLGTAATLFALAVSAVYILGDVVRKRLKKRKAPA